MTLDDRRMFDAAGDPVDIRTHIGTVYAQPDFGNPVMLDARSRITAEVAWYPPTTQVFDMVAEADGHASISSDGIRADLRPGDVPDTYILRYSGQQGDMIIWSTPDILSGQAALYAHDRGPDWLSPAESQVRMFAAEHPEGQTLILHTETAPNTIRLRVDRPAEQPQLREYGR